MFSLSSVEGSQLVTEVCGPPTPHHTLKFMLAFLNPRSGQCRGGQRCGTGARGHRREGAEGDKGTYAQIRGIFFRELSEQLLTESCVYQLSLARSLA